MDTINGDGGNDVIHGGAGDATNASRQTLRGGDGDDVIYGGEHADDIYGDVGNDMLYGGAGDDELLGSAGNDLLRGGAGNDKLSGHGGNDVLDGGLGNDRLRPSTGDDVMTGGDDNVRDTFLFNNGLKNGALDYGTNYITDFKDGVDMLDIKGLPIPEGGKTAFIGGRDYWGTTYDARGRETSHAGVTLDFEDLGVPGLTGIIHIQFTEPSLAEFNNDDILGWS